MEYLLTLGFIIAFLIGVEIFTILGLIAIVLTLASNNFPLMNISLTMFDGVNLFPLIALPLFIVTGDLISEGGIAHQIMRFAKSLVGWARGGLALSTMVASGIFAAISGSNAATVATVGRVVLPSMKEDNYPPPFAAATVAAGGVVGIIIPPSIAFVLYGITVGVSVTDLFIAGLLPGIFMLICLSCVAYIYGRFFGYGKPVPFNFRDLVESAGGTKYAIGAVLIILVGIYGGIFTPTEAGGVSAVYCLLVGWLVTRQITLKRIPFVLNQSAMICGVVVPIVALALVLSQNIALLRVPEMMMAGFMSLTSDPITQRLLILALLLLVGCFMESAPSILLLAPLLVPIGNSLGIDPVHFGVIVVSTLAVGFITPPLGLNLFVASAISGVPFGEIARATVSYIIVLIFSLIVITFVPELSMAFVK